MAKGSLFILARDEQGTLTHQSVNDVQDVGVVNDLVAFLKGGAEAPAAAAAPAAPGPATTAQ